jgi:hypothetical protein
MMTFPSEDATYRGEPEWTGDMLVQLRLFVRATADMRAAQKRYFRERTPSALQESKRLEREVDQKLKAWTASASI